MKIATYKLYQDDLGPLSKPYDELKTFFRTLRSMKLTFTMLNAHLIYNYPIVHQWKINMFFDFSARGGRIVVYLDVLKEGIAVSGFNSLCVFETTKLNWLHFFFSSTLQFLLWICWNFGKWLLISFCLWYQRFQQLLEFELSKLLLIYFWYKYFCFPSFFVR